MITTPAVRIRGCGVLVLAAVLGAAPPARAQAATEPASSRCGAPPTVAGIARETVQDFGRLGSGGSLGLLAVGGVAALGAHSIDRDVSREFPGMNLNSGFKPGAVIGSTPFQLGASIGTYALGRAFGNSCLARVGADLIQAQVMAETLTMIVKQATRRSRPEGTGYSFPSGHTTVTFASATVLQRHFGWKVGLPAYGVATYVAASRVEMRRHFLSDVAFGAALGIASGRTVPIGHGQRLMISPMASPSGSGVGAGFTLIK
jgi:membrane-associated phospholipid phosphatase